MQQCVRCIVNLHLLKLQWDDSEGTAIFLEGPPVFVRVCLLGLLQHSRLHRTNFPITIDQKLSFDRVLTNCRNPSLFNEVIRGEHVRIELIQVSADYKGGKILGRYASPLPNFLFPVTEIDIREIKLNKSRKYQDPPRLFFSTSTILLESTVVSPINSLVRRTSATSPTKVGLRESESEPVHLNHAPELHLDVQHPATSELHSMLSSYYHCPSLTGGTTNLQGNARPHKGLGSTSQKESTPQDTTPSTCQLQDNRTTRSYHGKCHWRECPGQVTSTSSSPSLTQTQSHHRRSCTLRNHGRVGYFSSLEETDPVLTPRTASAPDTRPPFVVRRVNPALLGKRNFHEENRPHTTQHFSKLESLPTSCAVPNIYLNDHPTTGSFSFQDFFGMSSRQIHPSHPTTSSSYVLTSTEQGNLQTPEASSNHSFLSSVPAGTSQSPRSLPQEVTSELPLRTYHPGACELVSKYLMAQPGNTRKGVASPSKQIEDKLQTVMRECCDCKHTSESIGEDSLTEDLDRLRASLAAERDETLNKSATVVPNQSLTVRLGPQDYWSQRMTEFTGRCHRDLFGENMERIYSKLYQEAASLH